MFSAFQFFLFLHITAAIIAFGPSFAFPIIGAMSGKEPMHGNFGLRLTAAIEDRIVIPAALTMPVSGVLMVVTSTFGFGHFWLLAGITLYVIAMLFATIPQRNWVHEMVHMTERMAPPSAAMAAGPGAAPAGPPPEFIALRNRVQMGGMFLTVLLILILILMIFRPLN